MNRTAHHHMFETSIRSTNGMFLQAGISLVELVITIVVLSVGVTGILSVMNLTSAKSADPMIATQAHAIAQSYLEEVLLRDYLDPDGVEVGETRVNFDDIDDFNNLVANGCLVTSPACPTLGDCVCDQFGEPIASLAGYNVAISVSAETLNGKTAQRVDVSVGHDRFASLDMTLSGYRTNY